MRRYDVIDCTKTTGVTATFPFAWMAHAASMIISAWTGRMHDYTPRV